MLEVVEDSVLLVPVGLYVEVELLTGYRALDDGIGMLVPTEILEEDEGDPVVNTPIAEEVLDSEDTPVPKGTKLDVWLKIGYGAEEDPTTTLVPWEMLYVGNPVLNVPIEE